jgi:lysophospholipase
MRPAAETFAPFFIETGGIRLRAARFEADKPRGLCVLLNGQTEFIEKYFEVIDDLGRRGFHVATMDWRGQGGSDRLLADPRKAHIADFAQYDADLDALMQQVVRPMTASLPHARSADGTGARSRPSGQRRAEGESKIVALAHSMGGHILLRRLHQHPAEFSAVALCAPMIGIQPRGVPWWLVAAVTRYLNRHSPSEDFVWGMAKRDQLGRPFEAQIVTSDRQRYQRTQAILAAHPDLRLNGPTWGWLAAALKSIMQLHQPGYPEAITTRAILWAAGEDRVCNSNALRAFAARLPQAQCVTVAGAEHEILMERDIYRDRLWADFDRVMA